MNSFSLEARYPGFRLAAAATFEATPLALFGRSGCGKSTILEAIAGLRPRVKGSITLGGRRIDGLPPRERRIGWVPQDAALFPHLSVRGNLDFARRARGTPTKPYDDLVDALEIGALLDRRAAELSGGERQRVAIARALSSRPDWLLLDEPLAAIDRPLRLRLVPYLRRVSDELGVPTILVTHDPIEVLALARHLVILDDGRVVASGDPRALLPSAETFGTLHALVAENVFAVAESRAEGTLRHVHTTNGCVLEMTAVPGFDAPVRVAVRAEDILLATSRPVGLSAQNLIAGRIETLVPMPPSVVVHVRAGGERWLARLTERAVTALALAPGAEVYLVIKAHAVLAAP